MIIPVRCFTCNRVLASKYKKYKQLIKEDASRRMEDGSPQIENILSGDDISVDPKTNSSEVIELYKGIFKQIGIDRYCCKRCIISHIDLIDKI
tara:strand:+ start:1259 stop:1537 length:279 start_codon:yes stop_codon:yes gene_type:complete